MLNILMESVENGSHLSLAVHMNYNYVCLCTLVHSASRFLIKLGREGGEESREEKKIRDEEKLLCKLAFRNNKNNSSSY